MIPSELLTRLLWTLVIIAVGFALYQLYNHSLRVRARQHSADLPSGQSGVPVVLYFTTPECAACKAVQRPALQRLQSQLGERLRVIEVNAQEQPDLAQRWGVLSVPTTFVLDPSGQLRHINHGVAREDKLLRQLEEV